MIHKVIKHILTITIFIGIVIPLSAQQGAFNKAMKQGKRANGYYHIDFTHTAYSKRKLANFIGRKGYYVTNVNEKKVLQYGDCFEAVVSLDFLTLDELMAKYKNAIDAELERTGDKNVDENTKKLARQIIAATVNAENDIVPVELRWFNESTKEEVEKEWNDYVRAGLSCGFYCFDATKRTWSHRNKSTHQMDHYSSKTYKFISFEALNARLAKKFSFDSVSSSSGSGYVYKSGSDYEKVNNLIWLGNCVEGKIDGQGIGYTTDKGKINVTSIFRIPYPDIEYSVDGMKINSFVGKYNNGEPTGECKHYSFYLRELLDDKPLDYYATTTIYPFSDGLARYVETKGDETNISYVDKNFVVKIRNVDKKKYLKGYFTNNIVKDFENGHLTLNCRIDFVNRIEFLVDKNGEFVSLTKNGQAVVDSIIDETVKIYDKYISKVFNPNDIVKVSRILNNRFNYDLKSFPTMAYNNIVTESICEQAVENYKKSKAKNFDKSDYVSKVVKLMSNIAYLENIDKTQFEKDFDIHTQDILNCNSSFYFFFGKIPLTYGNRYSPDEFTTWKNIITKDLNEIGKKKQKPSNFQQIENVVNKMCDEYIKWWAPIYKYADQQIDDLIKDMEQRSKQRRQEMCSKCKIDGSQTTFPKGYYEGYKSWFFGTKPAESEKAGKIIFVNGDKCEWKYVFKDANSIEFDHIKIEEGTYRGEYSSVKEMMIELTRKCENFYCH